MNEDHMTNVEMLPDGRVFEVLNDGTLVPLKGRTDWAAFDALTEEDITRAALTDPDNPPLTDEYLAKMELIPNVYIIRNNLGLTQLEFAETYGIALDLIQSWERGPDFPDSVARSLLRIIEQDPEGAKAALEKSYRKAS